MAVEVSGSHAGGVGDVIGISHCYPGEGCTPEEAPPPFDEIEPGGPRGDEGVVETRMLSQPVPDGTTGVAGEVVGNERESALGRGPVQGVQERQVARGVACGRGLRQDLAIAHTEGAIDPHLLETAVIL